MRFSGGSRTASTVRNRHAAVIADESNSIVVRFRISKLRGCEAVAVDVAGQGFEERVMGSHPFDRMLAARVSCRLSRFGVIRLW